MLALPKLSPSGYRQIKPQKRNEKLKMKNSCGFESEVKVVREVIAHLGELGAYLSEEWKVKSEKSKCKRIAYK